MQGLLVAVTSTTNGKRKKNERERERPYIASSVKL
jgi:hypothetical protein